MGDGVIELRRLREAVDAAGYAGPIEVEIFNQQIWDTPGEQVLELMKARFRTEVLSAKRPARGPRGSSAATRWAGQAATATFVANWGR